MNDTLPDFRGKIVLVYHIGSRDPQISSVIESPVFDHQGDRLFLCGRVVEGDTPNDWILGCRICLAWDTVETYIVFNSPEDYRSRIERGRAVQAPTTVQ